MAEGGNMLCNSDSDQFHPCGAMLPFVPPLNYLMWNSKHYKTVIRN